MTHLHYKFNREAERKKESESMCWWLVAMLILNMRFQPALHVPQCSIPAPSFRPF